MTYFHTIKSKEIEEIAKWFEENKVICEEDFYQVDRVNENLPELGIIVYNFLISNRLWYPSGE